MPSPATERFMEKYRNDSDFRESHWRRSRKYKQRIRLATMLLISKNIECNKCGFSNILALQIDHVNGGGGEERRLVKSHQQLFKKVEEDPSRYQILCANCNYIKRYEMQELRKGSIYD